MKSLDDSASFWEHVDDLRRTLIGVIGTLVLGIICALIFYPSIFSFITKPLQSLNAASPLQHQEIRRERISNSSSQETLYTLPSDVQNPLVTSPEVKEITPRTFAIPKGGFLEIERTLSSKNLVVFGPLEGMIIALKTCFWIGLVGTSPIWLLLILKFVAPALRQSEQRLLIPFLLTSLLFLSIGFIFAFFITIPIANRYLYLFNESLGTNLWSLSSYLDYTIFLLLANGIAFELSVIVIFMIHLGLLSAERMAQKRRQVIVGAFILGAILTPPDIATQFMLAIPLIGMYELTILYARLKEKSLRRKEMIDKIT